MTKNLLTLAAGFALTASVAAADTGAGRKDLQVFNDISKAVTRYAQFTIFDSVDASVKEGVVTLTGRVTMPYKKEAIEKRVAKVDNAWNTVVTEAFDKAMDEYKLDREQFPLRAVVALVATFNVGMHLRMLSGVRTGHKELLDWIERFLEDLEAKKVRRAAK